MRVMILGDIGLFAREVGDLRRDLQPARDLPAVAALCIEGDHRAIDAKRGDAVSRSPIKTLISE